MRSLRARLTVAIAAVVAVVLTALAIALYLGVRAAAWQQHDANLTARAHALAAIAEREDEDYEMAIPPSPTEYVELWRPDGRVLARSPSLRADLPRLDGVADLTLPDGRPGRAIGIRFNVRDEQARPPIELPLVLADGVEDVEAAVARIRTWFLGLGLIALAAIAAVTWWTLGRGLRPLARLAAALEEIDDRTLSTRLPLDGQPAELVVPVRTLNDLLARLGASFAREREFTADVGHELRTPLAGLRTLLEVTALGDRTGTEYRAALADAHAIVLQLGALVENLLMLARIDAGQVEIAAHDVELRGLVEECWRPHAALAASRSLELRNAVPEGAIVHTDREKLRVVIGNLLSNAAEYTEPGGWIEITAGGEELVTVTDSGPAIPADQLPKLFERLWRGDDARAATGVHCGIGLSLARSLCECLALSLTATSSPDGRVSFRVAAATPRMS